MSNHEYRGTQMVVVSDVTFTPGEQTHLHRAAAMITNAGCTGDIIPIVLWGKKAVIAAYHLYKGKHLNIKGVLKSRFRDIGGVSFHEVNVHVDTMEFLEDSFCYKSGIMTERLNKFFESDYAVSDKDMEELTMALLSYKDIPMKDFDHEEIEKTGKFGNSTTKVWSKEKGFWKPQKPTK